MNLTLFVPCYVDYLHPQAGFAAVRLLESLGHEVAVQDATICCGQPLTNSGSKDAGAGATSAWYRAMRDAGTVVVLSSSCTVHLSGHRPPHAARVPVIEVCEFLRDHHGEQLDGHLEARVCLHSACHGLRGTGSNRAAIGLLSRVGGLTTVQARRNNECCGFGGTFSTSFPRLSIAMGRDRIREIEQLEVHEVVATDLSCLLHLRGIARAGGTDLRIRHVVEVLDAAMHGEPVR